MRIALTIFLSLLITFSYGQDIDDLLIEEAAGTSIDTSGMVYKQSKMNGAELIEFNSSGCNEIFGNEKITTKIIKNEFKNDLLTIVFEFSDACCISFLGTLDYTDNIIDCRYSSIGEPCECRCFYTLEYTIKVDKEIKDIRFNGYSLKE